ncbi:KIF26A (predicted) [Pycnogonum litorale]
MEKRSKTVSSRASGSHRAAQKLNLSSAKKQRRRHHEVANFPTVISDLVRVAPPPAPPALLRNVCRKDPGVGKVKVMLRVPPVPQNSGSGSSFISLDVRKKQVTVYDPSSCGFNNQQTPAERRAGVVAPKMFAFDAIFSQDDSQTEVCCSALTDVIQAVVNGADGCLFSYGHSELGKTYTMIGCAESTQQLGIMPCAISWLFRMINEQKVKTGARFSVRMSAVEVSGRNEQLKDLLDEQTTDSECSGQSPGIYLQDDPILGTHLQNQSELRAPNAEKASYYLDAAIASRTSGDDEGKRNSHMMVTLHVYQYRIDKSSKGAGVAGGRSRLHMFDLGSGSKVAKSDSTVLSLSAIGNVILAIFNGAKHVPYRDSKLTQLLKEALGSITCRAAMIAHISTLPSQHSETLSTVQLAARIHRMRRKKMRFLNVMGSGDGSSDDKTRSGMRSATSSDPDATSSSEQSCDTVIYVGPNGALLSDRDLTDNEGPPKASTSKLPQSAVSKKIDKPKDVPTSNRQSESKTADVTTKSGANNSALLAQNKSEEVSCATTGQKCSTSNDPVRSHRNENPIQNHSGQASGGTKTKQHSGGGGGVAANSSGATPHQLCRKSSKHGATLPRLKPSKESRSDEQWVDGPRVSKQKMESVGAILQKKGNERWVDGPASYGYMDDHKRNMIERWVEIHSTHVLTNLRDDEKVNEIWIDKPNKEFLAQSEQLSRAKRVDDGTNVSSAVIAHGRVDQSRNNAAVATAGGRKDGRHESKKLSESDDHASAANQRQLRRGDKRLTSSKSTQSMSESEHHSEETSGSGDVSDDDVRLDVASSKAGSGNEPVLNDTSTSPMQQEDSAEEDVSESDDDYDDDGDYDDVEGEDVAETECESFECVKPRGRVILEYAQSETDDQPVEIIEVDEPDEPVPMVDCAIQCNEEDIIACMLIYSETSSENPLPEVDQDSEDEHPLRMLSVENLASSFTDSRPVSVIDMESRAFQDYADCESTCSSLSRQLILTSPSSIQRGHRTKTTDRSKGSDDLGNVLKSETFTEKLERIAKLRQCYQQQGDIKIYENINSGGSTPTSTLSRGSLHQSKINIDDLFAKTKKGGFDENIYSEPIDINDIEYGNNKSLSGLQPMNGLMLETFYSQMRRVPPPPPVLSDRPELLKPTQIVSPLINNDDELTTTTTTTLDPTLLKTLDLDRTSSKESFGRGKFISSEPASTNQTPCRTDKFISLRHPDGASDTDLSRHAYDEMLTVTTHSDDLKSRVQMRSPGNGESLSDKEDRRRSQSESRLTSLQRVVPGQSCANDGEKRQSSKFSKLSRFLGGRSSSPSKPNASSKLTSSPKLSRNDSKSSSSKSSPKMQLKHCSKSNSKMPSRSLPTSPPAETVRKEMKTSNKHFCNESTSEQSLQSLTVVSSSDKRHCKLTTSKLPTPSTASKNSRVTTATSVNKTSVVPADKTSHKKDPNDKKGISPSKQNSLKHSSQNATKNVVKKQSVDQSNDPEYDSGNDSGVVANHPPLSSPYSRLTKPKIERHSSSGHGSSDNSSTLSGDHSGTLLITPLTAPKVISRAPQPSGTSSGYESMIRDSEEGTGSSSNHDSASDSSGGGMTTAAAGGAKNLRKKPQGVCSCFRF